MHVRVREALNLIGADPDRGSGSSSHQQGARDSLPPPRIDTLTSLRFFAAFAVLLYHLPGLMPSVYSGDAFERMNAGVDFFFVLSGYVLGVTYSKTPQWKVTDYFRRRFARIYPVYLLTTIVWLWLWLGEWPISAQDKFNSGVAHFFLLQAFFSGDLFNLGFNSVAWTISCEAFFYAVFPLIRRRGAFLAGVVGLGAFFILYRTSFDGLNQMFPNFFGYFPVIVFWKFCLGLALAQLWVPRATTMLIGTLLELAAIALILSATLYGNPVGGDVNTLWFVIAALFTIAVFSCQSGALSRVLMLPVLVLLGDASYSLYLWHHMLMLWAGKRLPASFDSDVERVAAAAAVIGAVILMSIVTYKWFEVPLRSLIAGKRPEREASG